MKLKKEFLEELAEKYPDDILYPFNEMIKELGFDVVYKLSELIGGTSIYIPKPRAIFRESMNKRIVDEFNGGNYSQLATRYNLCERSVRDIVNSGKHKLTR